MIAGSDLTLEFYQLSFLRSTQPIWWLSVSSQVREIHASIRLWRQTEGKWRCINPCDRYDEEHMHGGQLETISTTSSKLQRLLTIPTECNCACRRTWNSSCQWTSGSLARKALNVLTTFCEMFWKRCQQKPFAVPRRHGRPRLLRLWPIWKNHGDESLQKVPQTSRSCYPGGLGLHWL